MTDAVDSTRAVLFALGGNLAIAVAKFVAAAITGSGAMLAEGLHSTADCANQLLLLLGLKRSRRAPTLEYPLGFGKEIYFWSFVVAIMLFSLGGLFSIYEGWQKLSDEEDLQQPLIEAVIEMLTLHMGGDVMVAVKAKMRAQGDLRSFVDEINRIEDAFKQRFPQVQWTFFEPDVR